MRETVTERSQANNPAGLPRFPFPPPLSFFCKFLAPNGLRGGGANTFYRGQGACRPVAGRQAPPRASPLHFDVSGRVNFAKNTLSPGPMTGRQGSISVNFQK